MQNFLMVIGCLFLCKIAYAEFRVVDGEVVVADVEVGGGIEVGGALGEVPRVSDQLNNLDISSPNPLQVERITINNHTIYWENDSNCWIENPQQYRWQARDGWGEFRFRGGDRYRFQWDITMPNTPCDQTTPNPPPGDDGGYENEIPNPGNPNDGRHDRDRYKSLKNRSNPARTFKAYKAKTHSKLKVELID
ncbi:MAG: hypothetical protein CMP10_03965 [Zetaproteobacteria bacterium]|nr:hypothetical protein [Pseudobdellovibrionaceae bacterium]